MSFPLSARKTTALILAFIGLSLGACQKQPSTEIPDNKQEVASVNNYKIIVSDFKTVVNPFMEGQGESLDEEAVKRTLLNDMILHKILIQEAQKENLDKQQPFMREIERYWEQSLLKLILRKKSEEFARTIPNVQERERAFDQWMENLKKEAIIKINEDVLKNIDLKKIRRSQ